MRNPRMLFVLVVAIGCGLGASLLVAKMIKPDQGETKKVKVWRVKQAKTVTAYSPLKKEDFENKEMDEKEANDLGLVIDDGGFDTLVKDKKMLKVSLGESKTLMMSDIYNPETDNLRGKLKPTEVAVTIPVTNVSSVAGFVQPGHRVDISATTNLNTPDGGGKPFSQLILQNIEILATNEATTPSQDAPVRQSTTVTLRLNREQAMLLESYQQGGATLALFLRPVNDKEIYPTPGKLQVGVSREVYSSNAPDENLLASTGNTIAPPPLAPPTSVEPPPGDNKNETTKPANGNQTPPVAIIPSPVLPKEKQRDVMVIIDDPNKPPRKYYFESDGGKRNP